MYNDATSSCHQCLSNETQSFFLCLLDEAPYLLIFIINCLLHYFITRILIVINVNMTIGINRNFEMISDKMTTTLRTIDGRTGSAFATYFQV